MMGFTGKQVIHPSHVPIVQRAFSPTQEQVDWATELVEAFSKHTESGKVRERERESVIWWSKHTQSRKGERERKRERGIQQTH